MNSHFKLVQLICIAAIATNCTTSSGGWEETKRDSARIVIDGVNVNWGVTRALGTHSSGADLAGFTFTRTTGTTTTSANLSIPQRAALAERALAQHPNCTWVGFDAATNQIQSRRLGAVDSIIVAPVDC